MRIITRLLFTFLLFFIVPTGAAEAQIGGRVYACRLERTNVDGALVAGRSAMTDIDAPVVSSAQFAPDGTIIVVDQSAKRVLRLDSDLNVVLEVGRAGPGPGEYANPVAAAMDERGRIFVADGAGGLASVIVYDSDGSFHREDRLPMYLTPTALATDGTLVYVAGQAVFLMDPPPDSRPVLAAYDPSTGEADVLLNQTAEWFGEPPVYRNSSVNIIPKVDAHGNLYIGFVEGYEIWKITGPQEYEVVVRGCVPERALRAFEAEDDGPGGFRGSGVPSMQGIGLRPPRLSYRLLADFNILLDGRVVTRSVIYVEETGRRSMEMFSAGGELMEAWSLGPGQLVTGWGVMDRNNPARHLSWNTNDGTTMLVRFAAVEAEP